MKRLVNQIQITILLSRFGYLTAVADYSEPSPKFDYLWDNIWYIWEGFVFFSWAICSAVNTKNDGDLMTAWLILSVYFYIRFLWELMAIKTGLNVNDKMAMAILFIINMIAVALITYLPQISRWVRSQLQK